MELGGPELAQLARAYDGASDGLRVAKFVPASGAASRMFRALAALASDEAGEQEQEEADRVLGSLEDLALFAALQGELGAAGADLTGLREPEQGAQLARFILGRPGLGYAALPKALIPFHSYPDGARTAAEEHLVEAGVYARGRDNTACLHFTVSEHHRGNFEELFERVLSSYQERFEVLYEIELSTQCPSTDSVAVDGDGGLFRGGDGRLLFRPGGHGSLLGNLSATDADLVFVKNIDNCVPDRLKESSYVWKKALAGLLIDLQDRVFDALAGLSEGRDGSVEAASKLAGQSFGLKLPELGGDRRQTEQELVALLDRPLRVCGMVRNVEAPGGGPFWTSGQAGTSLQIVETSQMDPDSADQQDILAASTHFNPVDLVVSTRRSDGRRFELDPFVDRGSAFVVSRSSGGRELRSVERPGLWNGGMAGWLTVFVEVPRETFNPVKTVADLLGPMHREA